MAAEREPRASALRPRHEWVNLPYTPPDEPAFSRNERRRQQYAANRELNLERSQRNYAKQSAARKQQGIAKRAEILAQRAEEAKVSDSGACASVLRFWHLESMNNDSSWNWFRSTVLTATESNRSKRPAPPVDDLSAQAAVASDDDRTSRAHQQYRQLAPARELASLNLRLSGNTIYSLLAVTFLWTHQFVLNDLNFL